jgi:hypothetical protein
VPALNKAKKKTRRFTLFSTALTWQRQRPRNDDFEQSVAEAFRGAHCSTKYTCIRSKSARCSTKIKAKMVAVASLQMKANLR